eukprot:5933158-Prymnesium_polylepis.2
MSSASKVRQSGRRHSAALEQVFHQKVGHVTRHNPVRITERYGVGYGQTARRTFSAPTAHVLRTRHNNQHIHHVARNTVFLESRQGLACSLRSRSL